MSASADAAVLERLFQVIESRKGGDPASSHTAALFAKGRGAVAQKVGEEAVETIVASLSESPKQVASESADLLYHLMVLWADVGISPAEVWAELARREGTSGIEEKRQRSEKQG